MTAEDSTTLSQRAATWAADLRWEDLPAPVRAKAVASCRDAISVMFAGARCESARLAAEFARRTPGHIPLAAGGTSDLAQAAFANGAAAAALDFEDGHREGGAIHPAGITVAAALASVDDQTTVGQLLTAVVAGYEISLRAAAQLWPGHAGDWYHCTGAAGALGAAIAAAKVRRLDADGHHRALVIGWSHAPMSTFALPMVKEAIGWGAHVGATAAALSEAGYMKLPTGYRPPAPDVFPTTPLDRPGAADDPFVASLGTQFEILNTYFKKYASCAYTHAAAEGLTELLRDGVPVDQIASIVVGTHRGAVFLDEQSPRTLDHAQYSFPFVLATAAQNDGRVGAGELSEESLTDEDRLRIAALVSVEHDPALDDAYPAHYGSRVHVRLHDGRERNGLFLDATDPDPEQLAAKWRDLLAPLMPPEAAETLLLGLSRPERTVASVLAPAWASVSGT